MRKPNNILDLIGGEHDKEIGLFGQKLQINLPEELNIS